MPTARYLLVEGVDGLPVADPLAPGASPARYVGFRLSPACRYEDGRCVAHPDPDHVLEHYEPVRQVVLEHPEIRAAIKAGHLTLHAETKAKSREAATATLLSPAHSTTSER